MFAKLHFDSTDKCTVVDSNSKFLNKFIDLLTDNL